MYFKFKKFIIQKYFLHNLLNYVQMDQDYTDQEKIHQFLNDELSEEEVKKFKLELQGNPDLQEELAFSKDLMFTLRNKEEIAINEQLKNISATTTIEPDFEALNQFEIARKGDTSGGFNKWLLGGALGIALLIAGLFLLNPNASNSSNARVATVAEQLVQTYVVPYGIQINVDQNGVSPFDKGIRAYEQKDYTAATQYLEKHLKDAYDSNAQFYLGLSYLLNNKIADSVGALERTVDTATPPILEVAQWYLTLAYIKNGQIPNAKVLLNVLKTTPDYEEKATNLLRTL